MFMLAAIIKLSSIVLTDRFTLHTNIQFPYRIPPDLRSILFYSVMLKGKVLLKD